MLPKTTKIGLLSPITWPIPPVAYGAWETVVTNLARGLVKKGYTDITLFATKQAAIPGVKTVGFLDQPLGTHPKAGARAYELEQARFAIAEADRLKLDVLHNHFNYPPLLFQQASSTPMVTTLHGSAIEPDALAAYQLYRHKPYVSISNAERSFAPDLNYLATVYNAIDTTTFVYQPQPGSYLVQTGRIHPTKGVHQAIRLAKAVKRSLYLAGPIENDQQTYFDEQIKPFIDGVNVIYLGNISPLEVAKLVSHAYAFVALIDWEEPFGLSVVEAMACGTPVIGMRRGAQVETILEGETGLLVSSVEEAIERFSEVERIDRAQCSDKTVKCFSIDAMTDGYLAVYERLLSSN
ncbi:glycosyltransferase family 4 protein [Patescibacteria group bacterium]|nr:glycosyltransferase family 4 protein [Patescibacteria group bacterium]